jgi:hypothetical protein
MSWALEGGEIEKLDYEEELDYLEIRLQKLESKDFTVRRKSAEALAPYVAENRYLDEVYARFERGKPPHPAQVLADGILGPKSDKNSCMSSVMALAWMGAAAAPYASHACGVLMSHVDDELRWEAARTIGYLGPGAAEEAAHLMAKQLDPDKEAAILVRFAVCESLALLGPGAAEGAAGALAKALEDPDVSVQNSAAVALAAIGPEGAPYATKAVIRAMLEGTFEMRRLAAKVLISFGEACGGMAAFPCSRVLNRMRPCCRLNFHPMKPLRKKPTAEDPATCDKCKASGPFATGTDYTCSQGCKWSLCQECFSKFLHHDAQLQALCAEALHAMGPKAVQLCQVYLSRALGDPDEDVRENSRRALEMGGCAIAVGGSMTLYDSSHQPCGLPSCALCKYEMHYEEIPALLDEEPTSPTSVGGPSDEAEGEDEEDEAPEEAPHETHDEAPKQTTGDAFSLLEESELRDEGKPETPKSQVSSEKSTLSEAGTERRPRDPWGPLGQHTASRTKARDPFSVLEEPERGDESGRSKEQRMPLPAPDDD